MINSGIYDYVNVLQKAADASWLRQDVISNNIANADTPGYKRRDVNFESVLKQELFSSKYTTLDQKISNIHLDHLNVQSAPDYPNYSYRVDENNVDPEQENVALASNRIQYNALVDMISGKFAGIKSVIK
ncbi:flagellar basal body rod protein FlgB [Clostridia bacterium]|nr:flagellar basal body rod protein FlgB [Clostridia bacterium]